jgi:hypothetical protein
MSEETKKVLENILQDIMKEIYACHVEDKIEGMELCYEIVQRRL